jgi:hypothetical protein
MSPNFDPKTSKRFWKCKLCDMVKLPDWLEEKMSSKHFTLSIEERTYFQSIVTRRKGDPPTRENTSVHEKQAIFMRVEEGKY